MQSEDCQECNGTGTAELICGYERPCDACHGKGERPARKDRAMDEDDWLEERERDELDDIDDADLERWLLDRD